MICVNLGHQKNETSKATWILRLFLAKLDDKSLHRDDLFIFNLKLLDERKNCD